MAKRRLNFVQANQFTPIDFEAVDVLIPGDLFPPGVTLNRTWIDVRFNQFGNGTLPPEFVNQTGPWIWGLTIIDDSTGNPGTHVDDDTHDWLWREMVMFDAPVQTVPDLAGTPQWIRSAKGGTGPQGGKGQRTLTQFNSHFHWALQLPGLFGSPPDGLHYELFVHTLWTVP